MERYWVIDFYEKPEILIKTNDFSQAETILSQRIEDTDGECEAYIYDTLNRKYYSNGERLID